MQLDSRTIHLDLDLAELPIPLFIFRIIAERVIGGAIVDALPNRDGNIVAIVEGPASCPAGHFVHGAILGEAHS